MSLKDHFDAGDHVGERPSDEIHRQAREAGRRKKRLYTDVPPQMHRAFMVRLLHEGVSVIDAVYALCTMYLEDEAVRKRVREILRA